MFFHLNWTDEFWKLAIHAMNSIKFRKLILTSEISNKSMMRKKTCIVRQSLQSCPGRVVIQACKARGSTITCSIFLGFKVFNSPNWVMLYNCCYKSEVESLTHSLVDINVFDEACCVYVLETLLSIDFLYSLQSKNKYIFT